MTAELWALPAVLLVLLVIGLVALVRGRSRPPVPRASRLDAPSRPSRAADSSAFEPSDRDDAPDTEPDNLQARREAAVEALKQARQRAAAETARLEALRQARLAAPPSVVTPLRRPAAPAERSLPRPPAAARPDLDPPPAAARPLAPPSAPAGSPPPPPPQAPQAHALPRPPASPAFIPDPAPGPLTARGPGPASPFQRTTPLPAPTGLPDPTPAGQALPSPAQVPAPLPVQPTLPPPARQPAPTLAAPPAAAAPLTVLVVDDSKVVRVKTSRLLEKHHYRVMLADDGLTALQALDGEWPDLVITDVEMPGLDGFGLTQRLRGLPGGARTPVIMITSSNERHRDAAERAGVNVLLGKPYPEEQLLAEVEKALARVASPAPAGLTMQ